MSLVALVVLAQGVIVPPVSPFKAGHATNGDFTLTVHDGENPKKVVPGTLTFLEKSVEANGARVYALTLNPKMGDITTFEMKTSATGLPLQAKQVTNPEENDPMNGLMIMLQRPLWPIAKSADHWTAAIPNPTDAAKTIGIDCIAKLSSDKRTIVLTQSSKESLIEKGYGALIESELKVDAKSGIVKSIHEEISIVKEGKASLVLEYDGKI